MSTLYNNVEADDPLVAAALAAGALEGTESIARKLASGAKYQQKEAKEALGRHLMTMASTPELLQQLPTTKQQRPEGYNEKAFLFLTRGYAEDHGHSPGTSYRYLAAGCRALGCPAAQNHVLLQPA